MRVTIDPELIRYALRFIPRDRIARGAYDCVFLLPRMGMAVVTDGKRLVSVPCEAEDSDVDRCVVSSVDAPKLLAGEVRLETEFSAVVSIDGLPVEEKHLAPGKCVLEYLQDLQPVAAMTVPLDWLKKAVRLVYPVACRTYGKPVTLEFAAGYARISAMCDIAEISDAREATGTPLSLTVRGQYLREAITSRLPRQKQATVSVARTNTGDLLVRADHAMHVIGALPKRAGTFHAPEASICV